MTPSVRWVVTGSGIIWSRASAALREFIDTTGIPFYTTPQGRGAVHEDHPRSFPAARSTAFREADAVLVIGTRPNFVLSHFLPPRWSAAARFMAVNIDASALGHNRQLEVGVVGDAGAVLQQLTGEARGSFDGRAETPWIQGLRTKNAANEDKHRTQAESDAVPIHPLRLMKEVRGILARDAIVVEDGHDTLGFARHSLPTHEVGPPPQSGTARKRGHRRTVRLGCQGCQARHASRGDLGRQRLRLDGAEHRQLLPARPADLGGDLQQRRRHRPLQGPAAVAGSGSRRLELSDGVPGPLAATGERVERPDEIRPALERALASGKPAVVNVVVDMYVPSAASFAFAGDYA